MHVFIVRYRFRDGGSSWIVRADDPIQAIDFVKEYFRKEFNWQSEGTFGATTICQQPGVVHDPN